MRTFALAVSLVVVLSACGQSESDTVGRESSAPPLRSAEEPAPPFDDVVGFGRSDDAVLRDDTIALWEAWQRQSLVASCMADAGFEYYIDFQYPEQDIQRVMESLGLSGEVPPDGSTLNAKVRDGLERESLDTYYRTLYDVTLEDVEAQRGNFRGGCTGRSWGAVGSLWVARDDVAADLVKLNKSLQSGASMDAARLAFSKCAASQGLEGVATPSDVEQADRDAKTQAAVLGACSDPYYVALSSVHNSVEKAFEAVHPQITEQRETYDGALDRIRADREFLDDLEG